MRLNFDESTAGENASVSLSDGSSAAFMTLSHGPALLNEDMWVRNTSIPTTMIYKVADETLKILSSVVSRYIVYIPSRITPKDLDVFFPWLHNFIEGSRHAKNSIKLGEALYSLEELIDIHADAVDQLMETIDVDKYSLELTLGILGTLFTQRNNYPSWVKLKLRVKNRIIQLGKDPENLLVGFDQ